MSKMSKTNKAAATKRQAALESPQHLRAKAGEGRKSSVDKRPANIRICRSRRESSRDSSDASGDPGELPPTDFGPITTRATTKAEQDCIRESADLIRATYNQWRQRTGSSVYDLPKLGISLQNFYAYVNGRSSPGLPKIARLAKIFGVKPGDLIAELRSLR